MKKVFGSQYDCAFLYKTHHKDSGVCVSTLAKELISWLYAILVLRNLLEGYRWLLEALLGGI